MNSIPRGKGRIQQVFISCFTITPRNRHHGTIQPTSVFFGQFLHRSKDILYVPVPMIVLFLIDILSEYNSQGSPFQSFLRILTAVRVFARQAKKDLPGPDGSAINGSSGALQMQVEK